MLRITAVVLLAGFLGLGQSDLAAQVEPALPSGADSRPGLSAHVGAGFGAGLGWSEVTDLLLGGEFAVGLSPEVWLLGSVGFRDVLEIEARVVDAEYLFRDNNIVTNETTEIPMDFDAKELVVKLSPPSLGLFFMAGVGTVDWRDDAGDGFDGNSLLFGVERLIGGQGRVEARLGLLYRTVDYDAVSFQGISLPATISGSTLTAYVTLLFGTARE
ncbi:MAG: hypothetical protein OEO79_11085 [Gemmatimonadota bacterium]|nr:hypothetical protein [Gemmatimonadota bacterium]